MLSSHKGPGNEATSGFFLFSFNGRGGTFSSSCGEAGNSRGSAMESGGMHKRRGRCVLFSHPPHGATLKKGKGDKEEELRAHVGGEGARARHLDAGW